MNRILAIGATLLAITSAAEAAVVVNVTTVTPTQNSVALGGYTGYVLTLVTTDDANITAVDFGGTANNSRGFFGPFLQRTAIAADEDGNSVFTSTPVSTSTTNYDTHILRTSRLDVAAPSEDNNGINPPGAPADNASSDYGTGSFLKGVFGLTAPFGSSVPIAYLVLPTGQSFTYSGQIATTSGQFDVSGGNAAVPEPASLGLAAVASIGLLARRRKSV